MKDFTSPEPSKRLRDIVTILVKYGVSDLISNSNIEWLNDFIKSRSKSQILNESQEVRIRLAAQELGTTFIKLGQILSTRTDLISSELASELSKLQSSTPADDPETVHATICDSFEIENVEEVFSTLNPEPIASASIAQVHLATLQNGQSVVVKIMHDGIESKVKEDLTILSWLAKIMSNYNASFKSYNLTLLVKEFSHTLLNELDFRIELRNLQRFNNNFKDDNTVQFPVPFPEISTKNVLTMTKMDGVSIRDLDQYNWSKKQRTDFTLNSAKVFMDMIFRDRFYHADPHPGNLFASKEGGLQVIDCGMIGRIDKRTNQAFEDLIIGIAQNDAEQVKDIILELCPPSQHTDLVSFEWEVDRFLEEYLDVPLNQFDMSGALVDALDIFQRHHLTLPRNISSLARSILLLEGSSRLLDQNFNLTMLFKEYQSKILIHRLNPKHLLKNSFKTLKTWERLIHSVPSTISKALKKMDKDSFTIHLEHQNLEHSVNLLVKGILCSAIFLGSALLWAFKVPPQFNGYSIFGIAGTLFASYLTFTILKDLKK
jgi:ubiquinone biosynthesis protein